MAKKIERALCEWDRDEYADLDRLREIVKNPRWVCRKCGRAANVKKALCKPVKLG